jgi:hypothetical protein
MIPTALPKPPTHAGDPALAALVGFTPKVEQTIENALVDQAWVRNVIATAERAEASSTPNGAPVRIFTLAGAQVVVAVRDAHAPLVLRVDVPRAVVRARRAEALAY